MGAPEFTSDIILKVSKANLINNVQAIRAFSKAAIVLPCIKADAYGLGISKIAPILDAYSDGFCVGYVEEARKLRQYTDKVIYILYGVRDIAPEELKNGNFVPVIGNFDYLNALKDIDFKMRIVVSIDLCMNRFGFSRNEIQPLQQALASNDNLSIDFFMTHASHAYGADRDLYIQGMYNDFLEITNTHFAGAKLSVSNSGVAFHKGGAYNLDIIRPGISLYGCLNSVNIPEPLKPVISLYTKVLSSISVEQGAGVGYSHRYVSQSSHFAATIAAGYADGLPRCVDPIGGILPAVYYNDRKFDIIGKVGMDSSSINTHDLKLDNGCIVELIGKNQHLSVFAKSIKQSCTETLISITGSHRARVLIDS